MSRSEAERPDVAARPGIGGAASIHTDLGHALRQVPILQHCLILVVEGAKELQGAAGPARVPAGSMVALPAGAAPTLFNDPDPRSGQYRARVLAFDADLVTAFFRNPPQPARLPLSGAASADPWRILMPSPALRDAFDHARRAVDGPDVSDALARHRFQEVLLGLAEVGIMWAPTDGDTLAQRLRLLIAGRPDAPWSAADAARAANVSEATLRRRLSGEGTSFRQLLAEVRLSHGLMLLQTSRAGIAEIALACGYESPSRFAGRFRERFGTPPSGIRTTANVSDAVDG